MIGAAPRRLLRLLEIEQERNGGWPVPVRTLCLAGGWRSTSTVHAHLQALLREGLIEKSPYPKGGVRAK